jgi:hypothetical protein
MIIIGVDFHPEFQQIAWVDTDSGELQEKRLGHREEATLSERRYYASFSSRHPTSSIVSDIEHHHLGSYTPM